MIAAFIFYSVAEGPQSVLGFSKKFKHCNLLCYNADVLGNPKLWSGVDLNLQGIKSKIIGCNDNFMEYLKENPKISAILITDIKEKKKRVWLPWMARTCNEICRYASGIDFGFTFNPWHLYRKLLKYNQCTNYEIIYQWSR